MLGCATIDVMWKPRGKEGREYVSKCKEYSISETEWKEMSRVSVARK